MASLDLGVITVSPDSGSGNQTLTYSPKSANRGNRVAITATLKGVSPNVAAQTQTVKLKAAAEFVEFTDGSEIAAPKTQGNLVIRGKSNSSKLTFSLGSGA